MRVAQSADRQPGQSVQSRGIDAIAGREHHRDRLGRDAPRQECQRPRRGGVHPVCVVDEAQQRTFRRGGRQQLQRGQADAERVRRAVGQPERDQQRVPVGGRERIEARQHRQAQLMQCRERQLTLELRPGRADELEILRCRMPDVIQQRALADTRLAAEDEHAALAPFRRVDEGEKAGDLVVPADERAEEPRGHGPNHSRDAAPRQQAPTAGRPHA